MATGYPKYFNHHQSDRMVKQITESDAIMINKQSHLIARLNHTNYEKEHGYYQMDKDEFEDYAIGLLNFFFEKAIEPEKVEENETQPIQSENQ